jgi:hypothetical protein
MVAEMELERIKEKEKELEDFCLELMERQKTQTLADRATVLPVINGASPEVVPMKKKSK